MEGMVFEAVQRTLVDIKGVDPSLVNPEAKLAEQLHVDSIDVMDLVMELETRFEDRNLVLDSETVLDVKTVGDLVELVERSL